MDGIVVIAPFSTGKLLGERIQQLGMKLCVVTMNEKQKTDIKSDVELLFNGNVDDLIEELNKVPFEIKHVLPGAENGVCLADELAHKMNLIGNPLESSAARRSKYLMGQVVKNAGVRAARQQISCNWEVLENFIREWNPSPFKVIVKPNQSAGSDDVFLCTDIDQVEAAFNTINGAINEVGEVNEGVLVQEFLEGVEYVVDSVSIQGIHKVVAVWKYDKRHINGQFNVYFGMSLCDPSYHPELIEYNAQVLDALEIYHGPAHAEIMMTSTGPCLIEVGSRCHGGHGTWRPIATKAFGYNQIDVTIDSYIAPEKVLKLNHAPSNPQFYGKEVFLVSTQEGTLEDIPGLEIVQTLESFLCSEISIKPNQQLQKTIDLFTMPGRVQLMHQSQQQVEQDYQLIHSMLEGHKMFKVRSIEKDQQIMNGPQDN